MNNKKKIVIALSGGIDSAMSAYLVKSKYPDSETFAIFMQNWDDLLLGNEIIKSKCIQTQDWEDAKEVANFLNIQIDRKQFINEYWEEVFVDFLSKLKKGLTPNPDILCNSLIKFSYFAKYAKDNLKADYLVTGHYARIIYNQEKNVYYLAKSKDELKDQTYFLCKIDRNILPFLLFPLSEITKQDLKKKASDLGFPNVRKKESMGICFIGENNFDKFISNYIEKKNGRFIDIDNLNVVGYHHGTSFYTIGQRKGLVLGGYPFPYYVVGKDMKLNIIYVAKGNENQWLYSSWCIVSNVNWLIDEEDMNRFIHNPITAKFRHRQPEIPIHLDILEDGKLKVNLQFPVRALTPGQYAVFYSEDICLGGGIIFSTEKLDNFSNLFLNISS